MTAVRTRLAARSERERRLLAIASVVAAVVLAGAGTVAVRDDLQGLRARVAARRLELAQVRRLAAAVPDAADADGASTGGTLLGRLQAATDAAGVAERVASITPSNVGSETGTRLSVRMTGASLEETVRLLHAIDREAASFGVPRLVVRKHPDDPRRFDVTVEVASGRAP